MKKFLILALCLFLVSTFNAVFASSSDAQYQLSKAKSLLNSGDYSMAMRRFKKISTNSDFPDRIKREATYYIGYCYVKQSDPWAAIEAFQDFLARYEDSGSEFVPDALYVMGRACEETGDNRAAIRAYRRCTRDFPGSDFGQKSKRRLRTLDSYSNNHDDPYDNDNDHHANNHHHGNHNHHHGNYDDYGDNSHHGHDNYNSVSYRVREVIRYARLENNSYLKDQYIMKNVDKAETDKDFIALCSEIDNDYTKGQFLVEALKNRNLKNVSADTIVSLAKLVNNFATSGQFLVDAAETVNLSGRDYQLLAKNCSNAYYRSEILRIAKEKINNSDNYGDYDDHYHSGVSRQIRDIIALAKEENNSYLRDQYILESVNKAKGGEDFLALIKVMDNDAIKGQFLDKVKSHSVFKMLNAMVIVDISNEVGNDYYKNEFLMAAANKIAFSPRGYRILAEATTNTYYRNQIFQKAKDSMYDDDSYSLGSNNGISRNQIKRMETDPFEGMRVNKAQIKRVSNFIKAIQMKKGVNNAVRKLTKEDLKIPSVKENMKKFRDMKKFEALHNSR